MSKVVPFIDDSLLAFMEAQRIFLVATALSRLTGFGARP
jgi:hypothetical protein